MKKQFSNLIKTHPQLRWKVIDLAVNDQNAGELRIVPVGPKYAIQLVVWDTHWNQLPIIAADLYKHYAGADEAGYATSEAATAAALDILRAHGWEDDKSEASLIEVYFNPRLPGTLQPSNETKMIARYQTEEDWQAHKVEVYTALDKLDGYIQIRRNGEAVFSRPTTSTPRPPSDN